MHLDGSRTKKRRIVDNDSNLHFFMINVVHLEIGLNIEG